MESARLSNSHEDINPLIRECQPLSLASTRQQANQVGQRSLESWHQEHGNGVERQAPFELSPDSMLDAFAVQSSITADSAPIDSKLVELEHVGEDLGQQILSGLSLARRTRHPRRQSHPALLVSQLHQDKVAAP